MRGRGYAPAGPGRASGDSAGTQCRGPLGVRGNAGRARRVRSGHAGTGRDLRWTDGRPLESPPGRGQGVAAPRLPPLQFPPLSRKKCQQDRMTVVGRAAEPAGTTGDGAGVMSRVSDIRSLAALGLHPSCVRREMSWGLVLSWVPKVKACGGSGRTALRWPVLLLVSDGVLC